MSNPELLHNPEILRSAERGAEFDSRAQERFLGIDERDEMLVAVTAFLGPIGVAAARETAEPFAPLYARTPESAASAAAVASSVEFVPTYEAKAPAWRDVRRDTGAVAIMFATERRDFTEIAEYHQDDLALAA